MIIESIGASLLLMAAIRTQNMPDKKKIEKIFEYTRTWVTTQSGEIKHPQFIRKEPITDDNKQQIGMLYVYRLPLGLPYKKLEYLNDNVGVFKDGLHKNTELEWDNGMLHVNVYDASLSTGWNYKEVLGALEENSWSVPIGKTYKGLIYRDFDKIPHTVVGGTTRYGKTVFLKSVMTSLILNNPDDVEFYIIDLKRKLEFGKYENIKQVRSVAGTPEEAKQMLEELSMRMESIMNYFRTNGITNVVDSPIRKRIFVIVDEANRLVPENRSDKTKMAIKRHLEDIACVMGGLGVRLIFCTQYPVSTTLPRDIKQNSDAKISFRLQNDYASEVVLGEGNGHAADLPNIKGRCISIQGTELIELQTPKITDSQMEKLLQDYYVTERKDITNEVRSTENEHTELLIPLRDFD